MADRRTYIVHRDGRVTHRATGRLLGRVGQHPVVGGRLDGCWSAWSKWSPDALGEPQPTMADAVDLLFNPELARPDVAQAKCVACGRLVIWGDGSAEPCESCETREQAETRLRMECPAAWAHYDWIKKLAEPTKEVPDVAG